MADHDTRRRPDASTPPADPRGGSGGRARQRLRRFSAAIGAPWSPERERPFVLGEILLVAFLQIGFNRITSVANSRGAAAGTHGWALWRAEQFLHVDVELALNQQLAPHRLLGQIVSLYYDLAHAYVTITTLALLYIFRVPLYRAARNALVLINAVALAVFLIVPVAPPRLLTGSGFGDIVGHSGTFASWDAGAESSRTAIEDLYASMPSLHIAWATWVLVAVFLASRSRVLRTLACVHLALSTYGVLATANHYVLDAVAGVALGAMAWWTARRRPLHALWRARHRAG